MTTLKRTIFVTLFATVMSGGMGSTAIFSVLPAIGRTAHLPDALVACVFSLSALAWALTSPRWATYSDRKGRRALLVIGLVGGAVSMAMFGLVTWAAMAGLMSGMLIFVGLLFSRALNGALGSAAVAGAQAYIADHTTRRDRTRSLAGLASALGLGTVVGPALVPVLILRGVDMGVTLAIIGSIYLVILVGVFAFIAPTPPVVAAATSAPSLRWSDRRVLPFLTYGFVMLSIQAVNSATVGFSVIDRLGGDVTRGQLLLSFALLSGAGATLLAQWVFIPVFRLTAGRLLVLAAVAIVVGNLVICVAPGVAGVIAGYTIAVLGFGMGRPGYTSGASLAVGPEGQGAVSGFTTALAGACSVVAPVIGMSAYTLVHSLPFAANALTAGALLVAALRVPVLRRAGAEPALSITAEPETP